MALLRLSYYFCIPSSFSNGTHAPVPEVIALGDDDEPITNGCKSTNGGDGIIVDDDVTVVLPEGEGKKCGIDFIIPFHHAENQKVYLIYFLVIYSTCFKDQSKPLLSSIITLPCTS